MLETIFSWLVGVTGELLSGIVVWTLGVLQLDLNAFISVFPAVATGYTIFRAIGTGLVIAFGSIGLLKYFFGGMEKVTEAPWVILLRMFIAIALIWMGGWIVNAVVNLAKIPYDLFINMANLDYTGQFGQAIGGSVEGFLAGSTLALGAKTVLVVLLIVLLLITWNLLKLIVEVVERFLIVGILAYSSPLIFSTVATKETSQIFKKYISMFVGQAVLMFLSVWSLDIILSAMTYMARGEGTALPLRLIMIFAMCKIAQRMDTYMRDLGINVAHTGDDLLGDTWAALAALGKFGKGGSGDRASRSDILGSGKAVGRFGGMFGAARNAGTRAREAFSSGKGLRDIGSEAVTGVRAGATKGSLAGWLYNAKHGQTQAQESRRKALQMGYETKGFNQDMQRKNALKDERSKLEKDFNEQKSRARDAASALSQEQRDRASMQANVNRAQKDAGKIYRGLSEKGKNDYGLGTKKEPMSDEDKMKKLGIDPAAVSQSGLSLNDFQAEAANGDLRMDGNGGLTKQMQNAGLRKDGSAITGPVNSVSKFMAQNAANPKASGKDREALDASIRKSGSAAAALALQQPAVKMNASNDKAVNKSMAGLMQQAMPNVMSGEGVRDGGELKNLSIMDGANGGRVISFDNDNGEHTTIIDEAAYQSLKPEERAAYGDVITEDIGGEKMSFYKKHGEGMEESLADFKGQILDSDVASAKNEVYEIDKRMQESLSEIDEQIHNLRSEGAYEAEAPDLRKQGIEGLYGQLDQRFSVGPDVSDGAKNIWDEQGHNLETDQKRINKDFSPYYEGHEPPAGREVKDSAGDIFQDWMAGGDGRGTLRGEEKGRRRKKNNQ